MDWQWLMDAWQWLLELLNKDVDWGARIPAYVGLALSLLALWKGRTSVKLYLGRVDREDEITVSNLSPHAIEITSLGVVDADGSLLDWSDGPDGWPGLPARIEPRSERTFQLHAAIAPYSAYLRKFKGRGGCFIRIAGGRAFSDPGRLRRRWWWVRSQLEKVFRRADRKAAQDI
ncbi:hypothetical protein IPC353_10835 [Pseudomonas aeruginosa]|uniref:hypothetical protein n=1 Tax=Pseudomonas aeruginosa TaxID=287 RepID=UPI000F538A4B|nr:hypothetical protein [Pseudomonas aeruginosa]RQC81729.1 hypothetical protein IPC353_10835 [Pseudomonas aeruginosa]HBP0459503.1 hypothetical protein [Pseudomonas aeruginosa]